METQKFRIRQLSMFALAVTLASGTAVAADPPATDAPAQGMNHQGMDHKMAMNDSMHTMPATVDAVDKATGVVDVTAGGMKLKVHFPPKTLASVNVGDKITLHLGFTK